MIRNTALATAMTMLAFAPVAAQPYPGPTGPDPYGYYSQFDHNGYYDRDGRYRQLAPAPEYGPPPPPPAPAVVPGAYYREGRYENDCRRGNAAAGTIFGAIAGGLLGSAATRGNGAGIVGGVVLGGVLGNTIAREIDCDDQPYAFRVYATGLNGDIGRRYEWRHGDTYGYFTPTREYRRRGLICRNFTTITYRHGEQRAHDGVACREQDGHWRFD